MLQEAVASSALSKDYYEVPACWVYITCYVTATQVLGVQRASSEDEIKKAYRKLAMVEHGVALVSTSV